MPNAATVQDHAEARSKFINNLRKMKCPLRKVHTHEVVLELRAYTHITEPDRQHYDCIIYSTVPEDELRRHLRTLWTNAGGRGDIYMSRVERNAPDIAQMVSYQTKENARHRDRFYLPAGNGLAFVWGTQFFKGKSQRDVWIELRQKWFPAAQKAPTNAPTPLEEEICVKPLPAPTPLEEAEQAVAAINGTEQARQYRDYVDSNVIVQVLRRTPAEGLSIAQIAHRSGTPTGTVARLLKTIPHTACVQNYTDGTGSVWNHSGWFLNMSNADPASWQQLSDYAASVCDSVDMDHRHTLRKLAASEYGVCGHPSGSVVRPPTVPFRPYRKPKKVGPCIMTKTNPSANVSAT